MSRNSYKYKNQPTVRCCVIGCGKRPNMDGGVLCSEHYQRLPLKMRQAVYVGEGITEALDYLEKLRK